MKQLITVGSISREDATDIFPFIQEKYRGRRKDIKEFTHSFPEFILMEICLILKMLLKVNIF